MGHQFGCDAHSDFLRSSAADVETDWSMDLVQSLLGTPRFPEHLVDPGYLGFAANKTDIAGGGFDGF